ncbi:MAG: efflux RND transporter periplasmic adaptor subunit [Myxococcota bacterium]|nr:efflux RND transporter periplasmic adaptor subunit [Myxococcota bacterium]
MNATLRSALSAAALAVGIGAAVAWLSGGCGERIAPGEVAPPAGEAPATTAPARLETGPAVEWTSGAVESARRTAVASRILARIEAMRVTAGSEVEAGDLLVRLDARELEARVRESEEALRGARAALTLARTEHRRIARLVREGVEAPQRLDRAESTLRQAQAEVDRLEQALAEARTGLSYPEIRAPVSGRVVDRLAEPGDTAVPGRPLLRIYDPDLLRVEAPVRESLAVDLAVGDAVAVRVPALEAELEGVIDEIVPFAEPGARTLLVKVRLPARPGLFAGLYARIAVPAGTRRRVVVPEAAVTRVGQLAFVTVVPEAGPPARRIVTLGPPAGPAEVEVLSGVADGEQVALPASPAS